MSAPSRFVVGWLWHLRKLQKDGELTEKGGLRVKYSFSVLLYIRLVGGGFVALLLIARWWSEASLIMSLYSLVLGLISELRDLEKDGDVRIHTDKN